MIELRSLESNLLSMEQFISRREGFSENVVRLIEEKGEWIRGVLGDFIESDGSIDAGLESLISKYYQVIVPKDPESCRMLIGYLKERGIHGISILIQRAAENTPKADGGLLAHLALHDSVDESFRQFLAGIRITSSIDDGLASKASFLTEDGDFGLMNEGVLTIGKKDDHGFLSMKTAIKKGHERMEVLESQRVVLEDRIVRESDRVGFITDRLSERKAREAACLMEMASLSTRLDADERFLCSCRAELARFRESLDAILEKERVLKAEELRLSALVKETEMKLTTILDQKLLKEGMLGESRSDSRGTKR
ncbi:MAG: hypothetical protein MZV49_04760 [Rhodopseudomonas palustris]|nr:hypothetical protein [Rhodopseudomonas palustris]